MIVELSVVVAAYLLGSASGSILVGNLRNVDIRNLGSGNAGGTNAFRTQGAAFAVAVMVLDIGKGVVAALLPAWMVSLDSAGIGPQELALICGMAAVVGHCYPLWHGFRGGKGAATAIGALLVLQPWVVPPMLLVWVLTLILTGWVGLGTMLAALTIIPLLWWDNAAMPVLLFGVLLALFIVFTHRSNIVCMIDGSEYRFERARVRNWLGKGR